MSASAKAFDEAMADAAAAAGHREKRPLFRPLPPTKPFPVAALGPLRGPAEAVQMWIQAPPAMCGQSVLAATTLAVQQHRDVELPGVGKKPLTEMFVSVAESGERKTAVDDLALEAVYRIERQWHDEAAASVDAYKADHLAWKAATEEIKKRGKGNRKQIRDALEALGPEPQPPPHPMLLVADPTPEGLTLHLQEARPWGGVFTDEGGILVGGAAFNDESRMRTGALFNKLWDGKPIRRTRAGTGSAFLPGRRCSAHVMMQPAVSDILLGDATLNSIGMLARMLLVVPESTIGHRPFREAPQECRDVLRAYNDRLTELLTRPPATREGAPQALAPQVLTLTPDAKALWIRFHDYAERSIGDGGVWRQIKAFGAKAAEHAGRLAAVLATYEDPDAREVGAEHVAYGIELAQYYASEHMRLAGVASVVKNLRLAQTLLSWWQAREDPRCHLAEIYQFGPGAIRTAAAARAAAKVLEDHGWLTRLPPGTEIDGAPKREAWELVP